MISVFDLFSIGIGPSSSHTVGPMRAARRFAVELDETAAVASVRVDLYGSLAATGRGHRTDVAVVLGLLGERPEDVDVDTVDACVETLHAEGALPLPDGRVVAFDVVFRKGENLEHHPNALTLAACDAEGAVVVERTFFSTGGGFIVEDHELAVSGPGAAHEVAAPVPYPFRTAAELFAHAGGGDDGPSISDVMLANELALRPRDAVENGLATLWSAMRECVERGLRREGVLPGGLNVPRRAPGLHQQLLAETETGTMGAMEWVNLYALSVNEENASGGRVVTAPTNGAAGIVPAVLHYYRQFVEGADEEGVARFLLVAGAIGSVYKETASISGAEVGCQGEVGSASSMAAGALCEVLGGTPAQVENAAEIAMEHCLGLTCDPIRGLVQVPCIERNAVASVGAVNAAHMALRGDGTHLVTLDQVIATMRATGADMNSKYKETALGGLAVNVVEC